MAEFIEREKALEECDWYANEFCECEYAIMPLKGALEIIPAADVRPVVTCAECDWHVDCGYHFCNRWCLPCPDNADFYCAYGERPTAGP